MSNRMEEVIDYLHDNYYKDCERMANIKMIASLATMDNEYDINSLIDKCALFNSIEKSYPPKRTLKENIIRGIGFIMYGG